MILIYLFAANLLMLASEAQTRFGVERLRTGIGAYERGEYDVAVFRLELALDRFSDEEKEYLWTVHLYLGLSHYLMGDKDEAVEEFVRANEIIGKKLPDPDLYSPRVVRLFKGASEPEMAGTWKDPTTGMEFVLVKGGCYRMGDTFGDGYDDEKPVHEVCVDGFYIGKYEVTQGQWEKVMGNNPSSFRKGNDYPVEGVSWNNVREFIKKLNIKTGKSYRLPTEAEWEYAAKSVGKSEKFAGTSNESALSEFAWYWDNSKRSTHPAGQKKPNGLGIYDMSGNVLEWCSDRRSGDYYSESPRKNPKGPASGSYRVVRGGGWNSLAGFCRSSLRNILDPSDVSSDLGFRLVLPQAIR